MTARRKPRRHEARLAFEALSIEGGVLSPEWLGRVAQLEAGGQSEADYGIPKGLNLRDEIGRYWRVARAHWAEFAAGLERYQNLVFFLLLLLVILLRPTGLFGRTRGTRALKNVLPPWMLRLRGGAG